MPLHFGLDGRASDPPSQALGDERLDDPGLREELGGCPDEPLVLGIQMEVNGKQRCFACLKQGNLRLGVLGSSWGPKCPPQLPGRPPEEG